MGTARARSSTGLYLLDAQTRVVLTGTPYHQDSLAWYAPAMGGPPSQVEVELVPAPLWSGAQAGWWGLEARIDGYRVGELTQPVAGWYQPMVDGVLRAGRQPGVEAHVVTGDGGALEVELYLPVAGTPVAGGEAVGGRGAAPLWMGLVAAALLVVMIGSVAMDRINRSDPVVATPAAADTVMSLAAEPSSAPVPAPTSAPAVTTAAVPLSVAVAAPKPRPRTAAKRVPVVAKPKPKPKPRSSAKSTPRSTPTRTSEREPDPEPPVDEKPPDDPEPPADPKPPVDPDPPADPDPGDSPQPPDEPAESDD